MQARRLADHLTDRAARFLSDRIEWIAGTPHPAAAKGRLVNRRVAFVLAIAMTAILAAPPMAAQPEEIPDRETRERDVADLLRKSEALAQGLSATVGTAISPLVGIAVISAVGYFRANAADRDQLPWYNQPTFWLWAVAILLLVAAKDSIGGAMPIIKKPLDALELVENQVSALVALPIVIPTLMGLFEQAFPAGTPVTVWLIPTLYAADGAAAASGSGLLSWLVISVLATVAFVVVWFTGHVANVLVFLNPIPFADTVIKTARLALIGAIVASAALSPSLGIVFSLAVFLISLWLFGWSFRLTHLGMLMAWDILMRRSWSIEDADTTELHGFTAASLHAVPPRTYGHLRRLDDDRLALRYRRFLVLPEETIVLAPRQYAIGKGLVSPTLGDPAADGFTVLFRFLPRYRDDEAAIARVLALEDVRNVSITRTFRFLGRWVGSLWRAERSATHTHSTT